MTEAVQPVAAGTKTLGVALPDELHAQFVLVAGLKSLSLKDAVRQAVESWIEQGRGVLAERAHEALAEIEREATSRRDALAALFGPQGQGVQVSQATPEPAANEAATTSGESGKPTARRGTKEQTP